MMDLQRIWEPDNRARVLTVSASLMLGIALPDWWTKSYISLGFLYPFPVMLAAGFLNLWAIAILGATFVLLAERLLAHHSYLYRLGGAARIRAKSDLTSVPRSYQRIAAPKPAAFFLNDKRRATDPDDQ